MINDIFALIYSCVVGTAGSIASQLVAGESLRLDPILAFGAYGYLVNSVILLILIIILVHI